MSKESSTMSKEEVLTFGLILEAGDWVNEIETTEEDLELYRKAAYKVYGLTEKSAPEDFELAEEKQKEDLNLLLEPFRDKLREFTK